MYGWDRHGRIYRTSKSNDKIVLGSIQCVFRNRSHPLLCQPVKRNTKSIDWTQHADRIACWNRKKCRKEINSPKTNVPNQIGSFAFSKVVSGMWTHDLHYQSQQPSINPTFSSQTASKTCFFKGRWTAVITRRGTQASLHSGWKRNVFQWAMYACYTRMSEDLSLLGDCSLVFACLIVREICLLFCACILLKNNQPNSTWIINA